MLKRGFQFAPGYRLQEFLGRGQFGQVWRATAPGGAATAAKFIDLSDGQGQKEYEGVRRVKQIRHANLMPITAIWLLDGQGKVIEEAPDEAIETIDLSVAEAKGQSAVYRPEVEPSWLVVAMLLGGKSLQQRLRECVQEGLPGIPPKELISYMDESAKGIDFLNSPQHDLGEGPIAIQHSDIKPANIVLIGSSAVVCDFGLARILTRNQVTATSAAGTPAYMAPEAISGKPSRTSDQYSLAVTYYHLRTGTLPVNDGSLWEVLDAHRQGNLKLGLVHEAEQEVLRKATELKWENRFETCVEMVDALREALRAEGHTKPGFIPKSAGSFAPSVASADTKAAQGDPTATLDLPATQGTPSESMQATAPFVPAEESTKEEGFLKETLPELQEGPAGKTTETQSAIQRILHNPKLMAGAVAGLAGLAVLVMAGMMIFRPDPDRGNAQNDGVDKGTETDTVPVVEQDPAVLFSEAIAMPLIDADEQLAIAKFAAALELNPGLAAPEMQIRSGHQGPVMSMLESGSSLVTFATGSTPLLWNLNSESDQALPLEGHEKNVYISALSPNGERLLTAGSDYDARVWNLNASDVGSSALLLEGHNGTMEGAVWHPDGQIVATASQDTTLGIWRIDNATSENPNGIVGTSARVPIAEYLLSLATDPTGDWLAARTQGPDKVDRKDDVIVLPWKELTDDVENVPTPVRLGAKEAKVIAFLKGDGKPMLATGDYGGTITIYSVADGKLIDRMNDAHSLGFDVEAIRVVHLDRHDVIVTGASGGSVHWWKYGSTSDSQRRDFCTLGISSVDVSADGRWVAAGDNVGSVWLWDTSKVAKDQGAIRFDTGASSVDSVLIDVNSRWLIAGCGDGKILMWDLRHAKLLALTKPTPPTSKIEGTIKLPQVTMTD